MLGSFDENLSDYLPSASACPPREPSLHDLIPLRQLPRRSRAGAGAVLGLPDVGHRLEELGLRQGTSVEMIQAGSPCIIRLAEHKLCFRADELLSVLVTPENQP